MGTYGGSLTRWLRDLPRLAVSHDGIYPTVGERRSTRLISDATNEDVYSLPVTHDRTSTVHSNFYDSLAPPYLGAHEAVYGIPAPRSSASSGSNEDGRGRLPPPPPPPAPPREAEYNGRGLTPPLAPRHKKQRTRRGRTPPESPPTPPSRSPSPAKKPGGDWLRTFQFFALLALLLVVAAAGAVVLIVLNPNHAEPHRHFSRQNVTIAINIGVAKSQQASQWPVIGHRSKREIVQLSKDMADALLKSVQEWTDSGDVGVQFLMYDEHDQHITTLQQHFSDAEKDFRNGYIGVHVANTNQTAALSFYHGLEIKDTFVMVLPEKSAYSDENLRRNDEHGAGAFMERLNKDKVRR